MDVSSLVSIIYKAICSALVRLFAHNLSPKRGRVLSLDDMKNENAQQEMLRRFR